MGSDKIKIDLYYGEPLLLDKNLSVNEILHKCAENRNISPNSKKGFLLVQDGYHFIPNNKPLMGDNDEPIYYRYINYHTEPECLYYIDNPCFQYVYHQYKKDVRVTGLAIDPAIMTELCAMEILIIAMIFGDSQLQKPHKFIRHYKELSDHPLLDVESKEVKASLTKALKNLKDIRTEYECMEAYIRTVDKNIIKEMARSNRSVFNVSIDMVKKQGLKPGRLYIYKEKMEIVWNDESETASSDNKNCIINPVKMNRRELHTVEFSDPKLYLKGSEAELKLDIMTKTGRFGISFSSQDSSSKDNTKREFKQWRKCFALMFFYANLEYPRSRKEPCLAELILEDKQSCPLIVESCPLIVPAPPVHYKLTRQDVRMVLKQYGSQDGWYMFNTFDIAPKGGEIHTNGEISFSYCMDGKINQMTVSFSQEMGFGPPIYRVDYYRGKKFCSLLELASHFSLEGRRLKKFVTESMVKDISIPGDVIFPACCIEKVKSIDSYERGMFYSALDDKKHEVRLRQLPALFRHGSANARVPDIETMVRSLCDTNSIHSNLLRLYGLCMDKQAVKVCEITEDFGTCLHDYLVSKPTMEYKTLLKIAHHIASGIHALHDLQIVHGFPVLHNCLIDTSTQHVKLGGVGILRISIASQRLDGEKLLNEQPSFKSDKVPGETRFHPARWLPKDTLFDLQFNELTDRWCFGMVLWQIFNQAAIPLAEITDQEIVAQLQLEKDAWYCELLRVEHDNKFLQVMLENTINYCLTMSSVGSIAKVVRFLDLEAQQPECIKSGYTFANLEDDPCDFEDLEIEEVDGLLWFKTPDHDCDTNLSNYKGLDDPCEDDLYNYEESSEEENMDYLPLANRADDFNFLHNTQDLSDVIDSIRRIDDSDISLTDTIIGQGNFAYVRKGVLRNEANPEGTEVAVKIYHPDIKAVDIQKEIDAMTQLKHDYIIPLKGVYNYKGEDTAWLIMNLYKFGSLDKYIEQNSHIPIERLVTFASQIAEGMLFLSNANYIHRDLSTRNVLVQNQFKVRISDLGLSRNVEKQYYKHKTGVIPYLWYPPEFFQTHTYGKSLDVWSYGITCCEIFNNAEVPYLNEEPPISDIKMLKEFFDSGKRLKIPPITPDNFRLIITNCWKEKSGRWTFGDIVHFLAQP